MKEIKVTEDMIGKLISSYEGNKEELQEVENFIEEYGMLDNGNSDSTDTFEQGWNNAMEYVFRVLKIKVPENIDDDIEDEEEFDCEEICGNCDYVNGFNYEEGMSRTMICKNCGEKILLCSLCDMDEVDCDNCPYQED